MVRLFVWFKGTKFLREEAGPIQDPQDAEEEEEDEDDDDVGKPKVV